MRASEAAPGRLSHYNFGLDAGPDNIGMQSLLHNKLKHAKTVSFTIIWCFMHQFHLIIKAMLVELDCWEFEKPDFEGHQPVKNGYFNVLSSISNVWRSVGMLGKIQDAIAFLWKDDPASFGACSRRPGRCLRGRWGSCDEVEEIIISNLIFLPLVFAHLFRIQIEKWEKAAAAEAAKAKAKAKAEAQGKSVRDADAEAYRSEQRRYTITSTRGLSDLFLQVHADHQPRRQGSPDAFHEMD